jgi:hypothetical protein
MTWPIIGVEDGVDEKSVAWTARYVEMYGGAGRESNERVRNRDTNDFADDSFLPEDRGQAHL